MLIFRDSDQYAAKAQNTIPGNALKAFLSFDRVFRTSDNIVFWGKMRLY